MFQPARLTRATPLAVLLLMPTLAVAAPEPISARFDTADEVTLSGTFYGSDLGEKAPCALLLHPLGATSQLPGLTDLARALQEKGFAVLTFDFRGHGGSTTVSPFFWNTPSSRLIKGYMAKKTTISYREFAPSYFPILVNDIVAARRFLDLKNDAKQCNTSNLVMVGAQDAATLGAMWLSNEWRRKPPKNLEGTNPDMPPFGQDVIAGAWLSFYNGFQRTPVNIDKWFSQLRDRTPMVFLYGEEDKAGAAVANAICNNLFKVNVPPRIKWTLGQAIPKTKAVGYDLLVKPLPTADMVVNYFNNVMAERGDRAWVDRETKKANPEMVQMKPFGFNLP
jgi:hypothetical protein